MVRRVVRQLAPDESLYMRRLAGESLRSIAADYGVSHVALGSHLRSEEGRLALASLRAASQEARSGPESARARAPRRSRARQQGEQPQAPEPRRPQGGRILLARNPDDAPDRETYRARLASVAFSDPEHMVLVGNRWVSRDSLTAKKAGLA